MKYYYYLLNCFTFNYILSIKCISTISNYSYFLLPIFNITYNIYKYKSLYVKVNFNKYPWKYWIRKFSSIFSIGTFISINLMTSWIIYKYYLKVRITEYIVIDLYEFVLLNSISSTVNI